MGIPVLILGASGAGKTASLRGFNKGEILVLSVAGKTLPFRKKLDILYNTDYRAIGKALQSKKFKAYAVDDSQYLMAFEFFNRAQEKGYTKFTDIAQRFEKMVRYVAEKTPEDTIVYFLHHTESDENGGVKAKTIGRMLDEKLTLEGLFTIVLLATSDADGHHFLTENNGESPAKTPMEMFPDTVIDNDLKYVDDKIRFYYDLAPNSITND